jgi:hypothetical protein
MDSKGWDFMSDEVKGREELKACGMCCVVACSHCKEADCRVRLVPYVRDWRTAHAQEDAVPHQEGS